MLWILNNKRLSVIAVLVVLYIIQLGITNHYAKQIRKHDAEIQALKLKYKTDSDLAASKLVEMSNLYEQEKTKDKVVHNEKVTEIKEIIKNNPVYIDCKLDDSLYQKLREATTTSKPKTL